MKLDMVLRLASAGVGLPYPLLCCAAAGVLPRSLWLLLDFARRAMRCSRRRGSDGSDYCGRGQSSGRFCSLRRCQMQALRAQKHARRLIPLVSMTLAHYFFQAASAVKLDHYTV